MQQREREIIFFITLKKTKCANSFSFSVLITDFFFHDDEPRAPGSAKTAMGLYGCPKQALPQS
jgi:hypothetical protein